MSVNMAGLTASVKATVAQVGNEAATAGGQVIAGRAESFSKLSQLKPTEHPAAAIAAVGGAILGAVSMPGELLNTGVAALTNPISAMLPAFPAAHLSSFYLGIPHGHLHPPSLTPPVPTPIPLPTMGVITLGTSLGVLVGGMPAARAGDLGLAPTCGGLAPFFTVFLGSSKVFFGGTRAARQTDLCTACTPSTAGAMRNAAKAMQVSSKAAALGKMAQGALDGLDKLGKVVKAAGIANSLSEAYSADQAADAAPSPEDAQEQAALAAANALNAGMALGQIAADAIATALSATMGTDPAVPPGMTGFVVEGASNVLVGGMPMPNIPDPAQWLLKKLAAKAPPKLPKKGAAAGGGGGCGA